VRGSLQLFCCTVNTTNTTNLSTDGLLAHEWPFPRGVWKENQKKRLDSSSL